jgi:hypothetical protein
LAILNAAMDDIITLQRQVAIFQQAQATKNQFTQTIQALAPSFGTPMLALLGAPVGQRWVIDVTPTGALGFYSDSDDTFTIGTDTRFYLGSVFRLKFLLSPNGNLEAQSFTP